jgi:hypothetical protein
VSYSLEIMHDAHAGLRRLDPAVQEEVLDEIERLVTDPSLLNRYGPATATSYDFVRVERDAVRYVFIGVNCDHANRHIQVVRVGEFVKPIGRRP